MINDSTWCPECAGKTPTIEKFQVMARERGGKCLSQRYYDHKTKLTWQCSVGHTWETTPDKITQGSWCHICAGNKKLRVEDMQRLAREKGGLCLSKTYTNNRTKLVWKCSEGHIWEARPSSIQNNVWCKICKKAERTAKQKI